MNSSVKSKNFWKAFTPLFLRMIATEFVALVLSLAVLFGIILLLRNTIETIDPRRLELIGILIRPLVPMLIFLVQFFLTLYFFRYILKRKNKGVNFRLHGSTNFKRETFWLWMKTFVLSKFTIFALSNAFMITTGIHGIRRTTLDLPLYLLFGYLLYTQINRKQKSGVMLVIEE